MGDSEAKYQLEKLAASDDVTLEPELLAAYIEAARQMKTWVLLRLAKLYVNELPPMEQDIWKGMGYLKELVSLAGGPHLSKRDNAHIAQAAKLLSKLEDENNRMRVEPAFSLFNYKESEEIDTSPVYRDIDL
jgi:hypothetical protein